MSKPAEFFLKHRRKLLIAAALMLPVGYVLSYPVAYRVLIGSDANSVNSVPNSLFCSLTGNQSEEAWDRWRLWQKLQTYYYPPAEWLMDRTIISHPLLFWAWIVDVDKQINSDIDSRAFQRRLEWAVETNNFDVVIAEQDRKYQAFLHSREDVEPTDASADD